MRYSKIIGLYKELEDKCFLVTEVYSEQGTWNEEVSVLPKVYLTVDALLKDYPEDKFNSCIFTKDNGELFEYEKHLLTYRKLPEYEGFKELYKEYTDYKTKLYVDDYSFVLTENAKSMPEKQRDSLIENFDFYSNQVNSLMDLSTSYHVVVADRIG